MADSKITELAMAAALSGSEFLYALEGSSDTKISPVQFARYMIESYHFDTENNNSDSIAGATNLLNTIGTNINQLLLSVHPVGSLYWSSKNTSPASLFGGTWTQIKDRFVLSAGDSFANGNTGGAATHTLTVAEMPSHNHGGVSGGPSNNTSGGSSASSTGSNSASHTHSIVALSGSTSQSSTHTHNLSLNGVISSSGEGFGRCMLNSTGNTTYASSSSGAHTHTVTTTASTTGNNSAKHTHTLSNHTHTLQNHTHSVTSQGSGSAHTNMPPYIAKYCWERTA